MPESNGSPKSARLGPPVNGPPRSVPAGVRSEAESQRLIGEPLIHTSAATIDCVVMTIYRDTETDLPNWTLFQEFLTHTRIRASRSGEGFGVALVHACCVDPDADEAGPIGFRRAVAALLRDAVRDSDTVAVGPQGLFLLLFQNLPDRDKADACLTRVLSAIPGRVAGEPYFKVALGDCTLPLKLRIGLAVSLAPHASAHDTIRDAEVALARAMAKADSIWTAAEEFAIFDEKRDADLRNELARSA